MNDYKRDLYKIIDKSLENTNIRKFLKGEPVEGVIEALDKTFMLVKVDGVFDVIVPANEMDKVNPYEVGDKVNIFIMKQEDEYGVILGSQKRTTPHYRWKLLEQALKNGTIMTVEVVEVNNGGVLVTIDNVMGFIPTSQLDPNRLYKILGHDSEGKELISAHEITRKLGKLIGAKIKVRVSEIDPNNSRVIFSERMALDNSLVHAKAQALKTFKVGDILEGVVTAVTNYGIFVNAQGLDGLVHVSEISWDKVEDPSQFAKVGDKVKVKVIDMDEKGKRVAFSIKQLTKDPWQDVAVGYRIGSQVEGVITDIEDYGLIVKLGEGVTGLVHRSEVSDSFIGDLKDHFKLGQTVKAVILTISPSERKMGLSIKRLKQPKRINKTAQKVSKFRKRFNVSALDIQKALQEAQENSKKQDDSDDSNVG